MTEINTNSRPTNGRRAAAVIAGSAFTLSTVAFGAPAAFADGDHKPAEAAQSAEVDRDAQQDEQNPEVTLDTHKVQAGEALSVSGSGFTPNGQVQLTVGGEFVVDAPADENGDLSIDVAIPEEFEVGSYDLIASDIASDNVTSTGFKVFDDEGQEDDEEHEDDKEEPDEVDPDVELASDEVAPGESLQISGAGFTPEGGVNVRLNPGLNFVAEENGDINTQLPLPEDLEEGSYELIVTDKETGEQETEEVTVEADDSGDREDREDKHDDDKHDDKDGDHEERDDDNDRDED